MQYRAYIRDFYCLLNYWKRETARSEGALQCKMFYSEKCVVFLAILEEEVQQTMYGSVAYGVEVSMFGTYNTSFGFRHFSKCYKMWYS